MATHSSILAWRTPQTEVPGRLQSVGVTKRRTRLSNQAQHNFSVTIKLSVFLFLFISVFEIYPDTYFCLVKIFEGEK